MDILVLIALIVAVLVARKGSKDGSKVLKYIGYMAIIICLVYIVPQFVAGFIEGLSKTV